MLFAFFSPLLLLLISLQETTYCFPVNHIWRKWVCDALLKMICVWLVRSEAFLALRVRYISCLMSVLQTITSTVFLFIVSREKEELTRRFPVHFKYLLYIRWEELEKLDSIGCDAGQEEICFGPMNPTLRGENEFNFGVLVFWGQCWSTPRDLSRQSFLQEEASFFWHYRKCDLNHWNSKGMKERRWWLLFSNFFKEE